MKNYVKPGYRIVQLRVEERIAGSNCDDNDHQGGPRSGSHGGGGSGGHGGGGSGGGHGGGGHGGGPGGGGHGGR